jgi:hypothetical protein
MTDKMLVYASYLEDLLKDNATDLGLANKADGTPSVYYGDQNRIPVTPSACVDPGEKRRELNGAPRRTQNDLTCYILVYHNPVKGVEVVNKESDALAEAIETLIHDQGAQLGGLVNNNLVTAVEFGYQSRGNTLYRVSRLTVEGRSQAQLPSSV